MNKLKNPKIEGGFTGCGGEHAVCSELLFRGFNASIMSVDTGLDLVATKKDSVFGIQVKTSNPDKLSDYHFDIRKVSFDRNNKSNVFYIFVLREKGQNKYLILPYYEMEKKIKEKIIIFVSSYQKYRVTIKVRNEKIYLGTMKNEVGFYLNNWDIIK